MLDIDMSETFVCKKNPEQKNIKYCVEYVESKKEITEIFNSVLKELEKKKEQCPRRIIYTQTRNMCATIYNAFCSELENNIFLNCEPDPRSRLVHMFHGETPEAVKKHIVSQLTIPDSCLRVIICTVAFGMGVNCSCVHECIHFGAPKSIEEYIQESGRIGRDGSPSISRILYNALLLRGADSQVNGYINANEQCRRHVLMKHFENYKEDKISGCQCCDNCARSCNCSSSCNNWVVMNTSMKQANNEQATYKVRSVLAEQKNKLQELLNEYRKKLSEDGMISLRSLSTEFYSSYQSNFEQLSIPVYDK
jgi:superfamily II DNA helicase RecQ